ncbi:MAG: BACON domain-containing protein [Saprospiraceae bacterium]|nr:BACON domain-containing protein [Saprospiraceae bacterium]
MADIWNNKYGVNPERRQNLINGGIDPDDAQKRINAGEGKPIEEPKEIIKIELSLTLSKSRLNFNHYVETSEHITVYSNAKSYTVPPNYVPPWCTVQTYNGYFTITVSANPNYTSRKDWLVVKVEGKEEKLYIEQAGKPNTQNSIPKKSAINTKFLMPAKKMLQLSKE